MGVATLTGVRAGTAGSAGAGVEGMGAEDGRGIGVKPITGENDGGIAGGGGGTSNVCANTATAKTANNSARA